MLFVYELIIKGLFSYKPHKRELATAYFVVRVVSANQDHTKVTIWEYEPILCLCVCIYLSYIGAFLKYLQVFVPPLFPVEFLHVLGLLARQLSLRHQRQRVLPHRTSVVDVHVALQVTPGGFWGNEGDIRLREGCLELGR